MLYLGQMRSRTSVILVSYEADHYVGSHHRVLIHELQQSRTIPRTQTLT
jgi:hypothetical protein